MPDPTDIAAQDQAAQSPNGSNGSGQTERIERPDESKLPNNVQELLALRRGMTQGEGVFNRVYKNPEEAYDRNLDLNEEERSLLPSNPSMLGETRGGVIPSENDMKTIGESRRSYDTAPLAAKEGDRTHRDQANQYASQQKAQVQTMPSEAMNQELTRASTSIYQIGSI